MHITGHENAKKCGTTVDQDGIQTATTLQSGQETGTLDTLSKSDVVAAVDYGLAAGRPVQKLLRAMSEAGCQVDRSFFHVLRCSAAVGGGFAPEHGVILCHNRLHTRREVLNAMAHELIHAYDHCRYGGRIGASSGIDSGTKPTGGHDDGAGGGARCHSSSSSSSGDSSPGGNSSRRDETAASVPLESADGDGDSSTVAPSDNTGSSCSSSDSSSIEGRGSSSSMEAPGGGGLDWSDCRHHACTEIRAANLSGDCSLIQELLRGNLPLLPLGWAAQQRACVARRAALSVAMNPACGGPDAAAAVVSEMMPTCLADTAPFDASDAVATC